MFGIYTEVSDVVVTEGETVESVRQKMKHCLQTIVLMLFTLQSRPGAVRDKFPIIVQTTLWSLKVNFKVPKRPECMQVGDIVHLQIEF